MLVFSVPSKASRLETNGIQRIYIFILTEEIVHVSQKTSSANYERVYLPSIVEILNILFVQIGMNKSTSLRRFVKGNTKSLEI